MDTTQLADVAAQVAALKLQVASIAPSYWPAIITGFFTLAAALSGGYWLESLRYGRQREAVIIVTRQYLQLLLSAETTMSFTMIVPKMYNPVFTANVQNIGLLNEKHAHSIVTFHQYVESFVHDVQPGGMLKETWISADNFKQTRSVLREAIELAAKL